MNTTLSSKVLMIDRSTVFNPVTFLAMGRGWSIWKGPIDGNGLEGEEQQDARSLALVEIDPSKLRFEHCMKRGERTITGKEKLVRLKAAEADFIRPDARIAQALFEEPGQTTLEWIRTNRIREWFDFPGTVVRDPHGDPCILCLYYGGREWLSDCNHITYDGSRAVSAVYPCK